VPESLAHQTSPKNWAHQPCLAKQTTQQMKPSAQLINNTTNKQHNKQHNTTSNTKQKTNNTTNKAYNK
jgi:hypothetical protein